MTHTLRYQGALIQAYEDNPRIMVLGRENGRGEKEHKPEELVRFIDDIMTRECEQRLESTRIETIGGTKQQVWYGNQAQDPKARAIGTPAKNATITYTTQKISREGYHKDDERRAAKSNFERHRLYADISAKERGRHDQRASHDLQARIMRELERMS